MAEFRFQGAIPSSKSVFNRALIVQSYFPVLDLHGFAGCDDVRFMREGLKKIKERSRIDCGEGGTTFRFMALRVSRVRGVHVLKGSQRLMSRPQKGLIDLLNQLGVQAQIKKDEMHIVSEGWKKPRNAVIKVDTSESSQYASSLILNSWLLSADLEFELVGNKVSESYFQLTLEMLKKMGLRIKQTPTGYLVPAEQRLEKLSYEVEADLSSMFTVASAGALAGTSIIENFPETTEQPDKVFVEIFKKMGVGVDLEGRKLTITKPKYLRAIDWNLFQCPDLFPVLSVVCSFADGVSKLHGAPHLVAKESNRIAKVADLFNLLGIKHEVLEDGMIIHGNPHQPLKKGVTFNPDEDHRMVMAAVLMKLMGHEINIEHPEAINKSFPEFWGMIGIKP
ncbi:3-phosphoshikimate 1-carboxyvinyltransferase [Bdellovibrio sp. SKB1291214]|uniref:3-phosphoshikimate 1-carboxyvinyltransferase n=1 Tax=Bdellovibrio sp. SKB1291214 TaxID=1732569 RepID=UPI000B51E207|nr:3-phosphoshikimate 1-carboxyvinyltransferase [Bdellovibrio sp. SKB1291214]UYL08668.1 3-phosphoshikimate 1-carboxyvinyltransferase [Bdellovibrio sp. SKB1291214]